MKLGLRVWILIAALILAVIAIAPMPWAEGVVITSVDTGSPAAQAGVEGPSPTTQPVHREVILRLDGQPVTSVEEFLRVESELTPGSLVQLLTNQDSYVITLPQLNASNATNQTAASQVTEGLLDSGVRTGINVGDAPKNNIRLGLDLTGGARVLLAPAEPVEDAVMDLLIDGIEQRLNVFGLSDVTVRDTRDFSGNQFVLVEIAGANQQEIVDLLTSQGEFLAIIGDNVVFTGDGDDIRHVSTSAAESGIQQCGASGGEFICNFFFTIRLSTEAAQRHADITRNLAVIPGPQGGYLNETLDLFLDGVNITSLQISAGLRGSTTTTIQISGSEAGPSQEAAARNAQAEMRRLQTVLATGSFPVELEVVKTDSVSAQLGAEFIRNMFLVGFLAILAVIITVSARYRDWKIAIPMSIAMLSEVVIILAIAALFRYNLDLAGIAGIIIAVGTGVDDQIIIVDEIKSSGSRGGTWKQRMKRAFFIIFAAFFTLVAAMLPLMWAGAGLVRGFAIMTIAGVTAGVLITRPAFAQLAEKFVDVE
jgi:preprotein translocase subunit SecD